MIFMLQFNDSAATRGITGPQGPGASLYRNTIWPVRIPGPDQDKEHDAEK